MEIIRIKYEKNEITKKETAIEICFKCSACSLFCPVTLHVDRYNIEESFIAQIFASDNPSALKDVWMCCSCEKCVEVCPQDVDATEVITNLKEKSYMDGKAPDSIYALAKQVLTTGSPYNISASVNKARTKNNLKEISPNENVIKELNKLAEKTGLEVK